MDVLPYWKMVFREIARRVVTHLRAKLISWLLTSVLVTYIQYLTRVRSWGDSEKIALSFVIATIVVFGFSTIKALVQVPAALHPGPRRWTPAEKHYRDMIIRAISQHGERAVILLRHMRRTGNVTIGRSVSNRPREIDVYETNQLLHALESGGIVYQAPAEYDINSPLAAIMTPGVWHIAPVLAPFLDEILYE